MDLIAEDSEEEVSGHFDGWRLRVLGNEELMVGKRATNSRCFVTREGCDCDCDCRKCEVSMLG